MENCEWHELRAFLRQEADDEDRRTAFTAQHRRARSGTEREIAIYEAGRDYTMPECWHSAWQRMSQRRSMSAKFQGTIDTLVTLCQTDDERAFVHRIVLSRLAAATAPVEAPSPVPAPPVTPPSARPPTQAPGNIKRERDASRDALREELRVTAQAEQAERDQAEAAHRKRFRPADTVNPPLGARRRTTRSSDQKR